MKAFWQSKVFWVNVLSGLAMFFEATEFTNVVSPAALPYVATVVCAINIVLRFVTSQAVSMTTEKE